MPDASATQTRRLGSCRLAPLLLPRLLLLVVALGYVGVVAWGCADEPPPMDECTEDTDCESELICLSGAKQCAPGCRYVPPGGTDRCSDVGKFCSHRHPNPETRGSCIECNDDHPCPEPQVCNTHTRECCDPTQGESCGTTAAAIPGLPSVASVFARATGPTYASDPNPSLILSSEEAGEQTTITLSYDFVAGELRTLYASLFLPGGFGVDFTPPLTCTTDAECPGGTCTSNACVPLACSSDPECPDFGVPGESDLPGFCFTPAGGGPPSCRVACSSTPSAPVDGSCPGVDDCPAGTVCTVLDDETCGCAPLPEVGRGLGVVGLDIGINGTIDVLAPVRSIDGHSAFIDLNDDSMASGEPLVLHEEATPMFDHRLTVFIPPADDPLNPQPFIPQSARTYLILGSGVLTNPVSGGEVEPLLRLLSVDPESGGFDDGSGLEPQGATFSMPVFISSPIFADGFESGDTTGWGAQRP